jgi:hypothetical protein
VNSFFIDTTYLFDQYESLRKEALGSTGWHGHGLALFLSQGMKAWLNALATFVPIAREDKVFHDKPDLPIAVRPDLTLVLADMVLVCFQEVLR